MELSLWFLIFAAYYLEETGIYIQNSLSFINGLIIY